jgi:uncharacterized membrane protein YqaE (UPF0057 family)
LVVSVNNHHLDDENRRFVNKKMAAIFQKFAAIFIDGFGDSDFLMHVNYFVLHNHHGKIHAFMIIRKSLIISKKLTKWCSTGSFPIALCVISRIMQSC